MDVATDRAKALLDAARKGATKQRLWLIFAGLVILALALWFIVGRGGSAAPYRTEQPDRGRVTRVVSATGQLQPLVSVNVGSTVSGLVKEVNADFNSRVRAGQVLARLDPSQFQQRVDQASAQLAQAQADFAVAEADFERYSHLDRAGFASKQLMSQQRAARARASAGVRQASAALASARVDLSHSIITSPINGVVVDRQINVGQSVAASFQAPTLFVIAQDLSQLQANIAVDEADIGEVRQGQRVRFTVDAFPDDDFEGAVSQVRQQGADNNGVISYTVVVRADNPAGRLLPGMTANAEIVVEETPEVLRIPNAAVRFRPDDEALQARAAAIVGSAKGGASGGAIASRNGGGQRQGQGQSPGQGQGQGQGQSQGQSQSQSQSRFQGAERLADALGLTEAQRDRAREAMRAAFQSAPPGGDRRAFARRTREAALAAIEPTLTPEQRIKLAQFRAGATATGAQRETPTRVGVVWVLRNSEPTPVRVELGVADDTYTEVRGGDLRPDDRIIVGGGPQKEKANQGSNSPFGGGRAVRIRGA